VRPRAPDVLPPQPTTLDKELPDGVYIYLIEVADCPVFKLGSVTICHKVHATTGQPCGRRCIAHRYFLGGREMPSIADYKPASSAPQPVKSAAAKFDELFEEDED
jgi:hypothetical protein